METNSLTNQLHLKVQDLCASFVTDQGPLQVLDHIQFDVKRGSILGIVGESGSGKSVTALSLMRLFPKPSGRIDSGKIIFNETDLLELPIEEMRRYRGQKLAMIFQEPMTALNPLVKIGRQIAEVLELKGQPAPEKTIVELLELVEIPAAKERIHDYPHQLSGGMRQRVMIAMALAGEPELLIADEPTTALDVTIQAQILKLLKSLQRSRSMSMILITHDLAMIADMCDEVVVMYAGQIVEKISARDLFTKPRHPYTFGLVQSTPTLDLKPKTRLPTIEGIVPSLAEFKTGCRFASRCSFKKEICVQETPPLAAVSATHGYARCWRSEEIFK